MRMLSMPMLARQAKTTSPITVKTCGQERKELGNGSDESNHKALALVAKLGTERGQTSGRQEASMTRLISTVYFPLCADSTHKPEAIAYIFIIKHIQCRVTTVKTFDLKASATRPTSAPGRGRF